MAESSAPRPFWPCLKRSYTIELSLAAFARTSGSKSTDGRRQWLASTGSRAIFAGWYPGEKRRMAGWPNCVYETVKPRRI